MRRIQRYAEIASTNDAAARAPEGTVVIAATQTDGRGRFGRAWHSPRGGLWMSVHLRPRHLPALTAAAALAVADAVAQTASLEPRIRFPNDLWIDERKLCGILIESRSPTAVVGIGLNVNIPSFPPEIQATSLQIERGRTFDLDAIAETVLEALDRWVEADADRVRAEYARRDGLVGRRVRVNDDVEGIVSWIDPLEGLMLADGRRIVGAHVRHLAVLREERS
jgi:BirA family biotin operon repressor/biotin-[acetyl-CoA-carboxylase] ligase